MEQLWVVVEFLVTGELLRRQADEVLFVIAAHKERTGDDIIIAERTVQRKAISLPSSFRTTQTLSSGNG